MRSVIVSLGRIARQYRPYLSLSVSQGQRAVSRAALKYLRLVSQSLDQAKEFKSEGIYSVSEAFGWDTAIVVTVADAEMGSFRHTR